MVTRHAKAFLLPFITNKCRRDFNVSNVIKHSTTNFIFDLFFTVVFDEAIEHLAYFERGVEYGYKNDRYRYKSISQNLFQFNGHYFIIEGK